jgi:hypothetical protein
MPVILALGRQRHEDHEFQARSSPHRQPGLVSERVQAGAPQLQLENVSGEAHILPTGAEQDNLGGA